MGTESDQVEATWALWSPADGGYCDIRRWPLGGGRGWLVSQSESQWGEPDGWVILNCHLLFPLSTSPSLAQPLPPVPSLLSFFASLLFSLLLYPTLLPLWETTVLHQGTDGFRPWTPVSLPPDWPCPLQYSVMVGTLSPFLSVPSTLLMEPGLTEEQN